MRRTLGAALAAGALVLVTASPSSAINTVNSEPAPERTEVGAVVGLYDRDGDGLFDRFRWFCSGTMIDDDTFLTAAHCLTGEEDDRYFVSLVEDIQGLLDAYDEEFGPAPTDPAALEAYVEAKAAYFLEKGWVVEGTPYSDPDYPGTGADSHDIGVIDFADRDVDPQDVWDFEPATLPTAGQLDELGARALDAADWWTVGYGTSEAVRGPGGHTHPGGGVRMKALVDFNSLNPTWVRLGMNASRGYGGACYGDSGGPNFVEIDGELILAATTITGDVPCYATNVAYRLDTESARDFLDPFVDLP
ncbi:trypsin-like serine protease [Knoellia sp. CPCC 206450]|uniref:trypsin-like serine protease n=1 Tax=Knoellia tibetensis TaxID=3404798 RepID=UPI003B43197E